MFNFLIRKRKSITALCIIYFSIYALVILLLYSGMQYIIDQRMLTAFPSLENILNYQTELNEENYLAIPIKEFLNSKYIIFDENGKCVYASNSEVKEVISPNDLVFISDFENSQNYSVYKQINDNGTYFFTIQYTEYNPETGLTDYLGDSEIDSNLNIIGGTLFSGRTKLTEKEFAYIQGFYSEDDTITKYSYLSNDDQQRTLVFVAPKFSEKTYNVLINSNKTFWALLIPLVILCTVLLTILLSIKIRKDTGDINKMIRSYRESIGFNGDKSKVLHEFRDTIDTLDELLTKLKKVNDEKHRILADISHDLKTPLTVINGCARAFESGLIPKEEEQKYIKMISNKAETASLLLDALNEYAKMEHPDYQASFAKIDICEYTKLILVDKYDEIEMAGFELFVTIPDEKLYVLLDTQLFRRCFDNLLNNALRYNSAGTAISVSISRKEDLIILTIADNGVGIPHDLGDSIFDPFVTENQARSTGGGTGLGLSIVKRIIEIHNGTISLKYPPQPNFSTEFEIKLNNID